MPDKLSIRVLFLNAAEPSKPPKLFRASDHYAPVCGISRFVDVNTPLALSCPDDTFHDFFNMAGMGWITNIVTENVNRHDQSEHTWLNRRRF
jgi:hypothetical protein